MREEKRRTRQGAQRHSNLLANGRGDARDRRREDQRLSSQDLDPTFLRIDKDGRITFTLSAAFTEQLIQSIGGDGVAYEKGKLSVRVAKGLGFDDEGRLIVNASRQIRALTDSSGGVINTDGVVAGATASGIATIVAKLNELLAKLGE